MKKSRLGWLGPAVFLVGAVIAGLLLWLFQSVKPHVGTEIDRIPIGDGKSLVLSNEAHGDRSFIELRDGNELKWQALIPHYAGARGRPAVAWSDKAVTVRVERDGRAEVFAFAMTTDLKLGAYRLAVDHEPITMQPTGPITLTDHVRAYELVGGSDWHQLVAVDLVNGGGIWKVDLGPEPVTAAGVAGQTVWVQQSERRRTFRSATGAPVP